MCYSPTCLTEPQTCLITGASSGLGTALARAFAARGYNLVLTTRRESRLRALATELSSRYEITVLVLPADLADPSAARALLDELQTTGHTIDVLVNNAGFGVNAEYHEIAWSDANMMMSGNGHDSSRPVAWGSHRHACSQTEGRFSTCPLLPG
ncbi:hypothetical protein C2W62_35730 [Candidatus Entotheonella serta]|nr:hypothetical protein C2W62_35730 [Candidatus Entotheonella serta]